MHGQSQSKRLQHITMSADMCLPHPQHSTAVWWLTRAFLQMFLQVLFCWHVPQTQGFVLDQQTCVHSLFAGPESLLLLLLTTATSARLQRVTCRELGRLICEVGMLVTKACDKYVAAKNPSFSRGRLLQSIQNSSCHKVRLLLLCCIHCLQQRLSY